MTVPSNAVQSDGIGVISGDQANTYVQTDQTVAQLRGFVGLTGMAVMLQGITAPGDGGAGFFYWSSGSYTDNGQTVIVPSAAAGQGAWLRTTFLYTTPKYTVAGLPVVTAANQGEMAYATNGRNTGEGSAAGTGCLATVNSAGVWAAVWSGTQVLS